MIIKEEGTNQDPALQANFPEFVIARGKVPKQSLYSMGLYQIYEEFTGTGRRQENSKAMVIVRQNIAWYMFHRITDKRLISTNSY